MNEDAPEVLPGSHACVGCRGLTFRQRSDGLCPRCAFHAENLMERIELDGIERDLQLLTEFDAYYDAHTRRAKAREALIPDPFWGLRNAG
jgi:hypothetical protein